MKTAIAVHYIIGLLYSFYLYENLKLDNNKTIWGGVLAYIIIPLIYPVVFVYRNLFLKKEQKPTNIMQLGGGDVIISRNHLKKTINIK